MNSSAAAGVVEHVVGARWRRPRRPEIAGHVEHRGRLGGELSRRGIVGVRHRRHRCAHRRQPVRANIVVDERLYLLIDQLAGHRAITRTRRHRLRGGQPLGALRLPRSSMASAAATFPSTACHRLSRSAASASAAVRTAAAADGRGFAVAAQELS